MALYRLPFPKEDAETWFVQNGGWDQGGHAAGQGDSNPTDEQAYAFDINHDTGGKVLAARDPQVPRRRRRPQDHREQVCVQFDGK